MTELFELLAAVAALDIFREYPEPCLQAAADFHTARFSTAVIRLFLDVAMSLSGLR